MIRVYLNKIEMVDKSISYRRRGPQLAVVGFLRTFIAENYLHKLNAREKSEKSSNAAAEMNY